MSDFRKLNVWAKAHALALDINRKGAQLRGYDRFALRTRLLRAAMAVPTNIAEGSGQPTGREFGRFLRFALNATSELEYHLLVARDTGAMNPGDFDFLMIQTVEVRKMLHGLFKRVTSRDRNRPVLM